MNLSNWYYSQNAIGGSGNFWPKRITINSISIVNETSGYIEIPTSFYPRCLFNAYTSEAELLSSNTLTSNVLINSRVIPPGGSYQIAQNLTAENQKDISSQIELIDLTIGPSVGSFDWKYSSSSGQGTGIAISQFDSYLTYEYEGGSVSPADYIHAYYNNLNIQTDPHLYYYISYDKTNETLVFFETTPLSIHIESCTT